VVVVGAGPVGLALAIDLAQHGVSVVVLDNDNRLSNGSRAICFAKRTLEIFDRLGCGDAMVAKGVSWNIGKVFFKDDLIYQFDLLPEVGHERPAFINLQQYHVEALLVERAMALPALDLRWNNTVSGLEQRADGVRLQISTPDGPTTLEAGFVVACDGARSTLRALAGLESQGRSFRDRFLIADIKLKPEHTGLSLASERWFWFDPPFHPGQSVLLHRQPDDVWRIDFQLGWEADPELEKRPENIIPRVQALLGPAAVFTLEWASVYSFACTRMQRFVHGRLLFAGDAAHGVSPFGARGANSGVQDADNLAWKLAAVIQGRSPSALLNSYGVEREAAADENILNSTRATDFITPKSEVSRLFRDATLALARHHAFARKLVNSGRLSTPATLTTSPLNFPAPPAACRMVPGAPCADAPVALQSSGPAQASWLLQHLRSGHFTALWFSAGDDAATAASLTDAAASTLPGLHLRRLRMLPAASAGGTGTGTGTGTGNGTGTGSGSDSDQAIDGVTTLVDTHGLAAHRYDASAGDLVLIRPDQHVCARLRSSDTPALVQALRRAWAMD